MKYSNPNVVVYRLEGVLNDLEGKRRKGIEEDVARTKELVDKLALISTTNRYNPGELSDDPLLKLFDVVKSRSIGHLALEGALPDIVYGLQAKPSSTIFIEANPSGIHVAKKLGCQVIGVQQWKAGYEKADELVPYNDGNFMAGVHQKVEELLIKRL